MSGFAYRRRHCSRCPHPVACGGVSCHFGEAGIERMTGQLFDLGDGRLESSVVGLDGQGRVVYSTTLSART